MSETKMETSCEVRMNGEGTKSDDFVAVLSMENGDAAIYVNTDALTLGMATKMVTRAFVESLTQCTEEERTEIADVLNINLGDMLNE